MHETDIGEVLKNERRGYTHPWSEGIFQDCLSNGNDCWVMEYAGRIVGHGILSVGAGESAPAERLCSS